MKKKNARELPPNTKRQLINMIFDNLVLPVVFIVFLFLLFSFIDESSKKDNNNKFSFFSRISLVSSLRKIHKYIL